MWRSVMVCWGPKPVKYKWMQADFLNVWSSYSPHLVWAYRALGVKSSGGLLSSAVSQPLPSLCGRVLRGRSRDFSSLWSCLMTGAECQHSSTAFPCCQRSLSIFLPHFYPRFLLVDTFSPPSFFGRPLNKCTNLCCEGDLTEIEQITKKHILVI